MFSFLKHATAKIMVDTNKITKSTTIVIDIGAWAINPTEPKIKEMFMMFEPMMFPRARSFSPFFAAITDVTSSGKLVPKATIVSPTRASLMPILIVKNCAVVETHSPPKTTAASPKIKHKIICQTFNGFSSVCSEFEMFKNFSCFKVLFLLRFAFEIKTYKYKIKMIKKMMLSVRDKMFVFSPFSNESKPKSIKIPVSAMRKGRSIFFVNLLIGTGEKKSNYSKDVKHV